MESASSMAIGLTSANALILEVLQVTTLVLISKQFGFELITYHSLTCSSVIDKPSCVTRVLTAFQPVRREAKCT